MFTTPGWLSVGDIFDIIWRIKTSDGTFKAEEIENARELVRDEFFSFITGCEFAEVIGPNGQRFRVGKNFLGQILPSGNGHMYFSLNSGLIQPATLLEYYEKEHSGPKSALLHKILDDLRWGTLRFLITLFVLAITICFTGVFGFWLLTIAMQFGSGGGLPIDVRLKFLTASSLCLSASVFTAFLVSNFAKKSSNPQARPLERVERLYGFEGFSLVFPEDAARKALVPCDDETKESSLSEKEAAKRIVKAFDDGQRFTRSEMNSLYQHSLSARGFGRAWDFAREQRPQLGRPGRKANPLK